MCVMTQFVRYRMRTGCVECIKMRSMKCRVRACAHTHTHTHTHTHKHTHTYTHAHTYTCTQTHTSIHTYTYTRTHTHTRTHHLMDLSRWHTHTHTHTHVPTSWRNSQDEVHERVEKTFPKVCSLPNLTNVLYEMAAKLLYACTPSDFGYLTCVVRLWRRIVKFTM